MDNKKYAVILAAGDGKRMKSDKPKVLSEVLFQPMLRWVLDAVKHAGVDNTAVIVGAHKEQVTAYLDTLGEYPAFEQKESRQNLLSKRHRLKMRIYWWRAVTLRSLTQTP